MRRSAAAAILVLGLAGAALGLGGYTFGYARGYSYLTNDPGACANCHIMNEQLDGWVKSSHRSVAVCNDCHTPHGIVGKYATKARNGFWHSFYFTTGTFHEPIRATATTRRIAEANCRRCHEALAQALLSGTGSGEDFSCLRCHHSVGHLELGAVSNPR